MIGGGPTNEYIATRDILLEVHDERRRQDARFGEQNHRDGLGHPMAFDYPTEWRAKESYEHAKRTNDLTWCHVLGEEFCEALHAGNVDRLREELIQVAAVAVAWIECIDRRASGK